MNIVPYTADRVPDVVAYEKQLRAEEDDWAVRDPDKSENAAPDFGHDLPLDGTNSAVYALYYNFHRLSLS